MAKATAKVSFDYKELDSEGLETLEVISGADRFNRWMYNTIKPFCSGNILELGSGIGNISGQFLTDGEKITLTDIRPHYCSFLEKNYGSFDTLQEVLEMDIVDPEFDKKFSNYFNRFDSIFSLNVIEHIEDDKQTIKNLKKLLKKGGQLIILVPAYQSLYNQFDVELGHYRRYTRKTLKAIIQNAELPIQRAFYFNAIGTLGWFVSGKLQKNKTIPGGQMRLFNKLVPIAKIVDLITFNSIGLSVICVAQKE